MKKRLFLSLLIFFSIWGFSYLKKNYIPQTLTVTQTNWVMVKKPTSIKSVRRDREFLLVVNGEFEKPITFPSKDGKTIELGNGIKTVHISLKPGQEAQKAKVEVLTLPDED